MIVVCTMKKSLIVAVYFWILAMSLSVHMCSPFFLARLLPPAIVVTPPKWTPRRLLLPFQHQQLHQQQQQQQRQDSLVILFMTIIAIEESDWKGAGLPRQELLPEEIPTLLMKALQLNDFPNTDSGLQSLWAFAGDTTRHIFQNNYTDFVKSAHKTARQFPTSFYGNALVLSSSSASSSLSSTTDSIVPVRHNATWAMETELNRVGGKNDECWIATQVMRTVSTDGRLRRWQWELRKRRQPPNLNCWYVESIASSDRKGQFEAE